MQPSRGDLLELTALKIATLKCRMICLNGYNWLQTRKPGECCDSTATSASLRGIGCKPIQVKLWWVGIQYLPRNG